MTRPEASDLTPGPDDPISAPIPSGSTLEPAGDLRTRAGFRILIGGSPLTITRLSPAGADLVKRWFAGQPVGNGRAHQALARRLSGNGMANLRLPTGSGRQTGLAVVIPVKDDPSGLAATLDHLLATTSTSELAVIVVDDGSTPPIDIGDRPVRLLRRSRTGGPGPARQTGLAEVDDPVVVFLDAGVIAGPAELHRLAALLDDRTMVATAPRVRSMPTRHAVARFDSRRSPLDLGPADSLVGPGRPVPYVPTACLVASTDAVRSVGGFDPALRYGEDVDLVWRLGRIGTVRYQPAVEVGHSPRATLAAMARQRIAYGSSAAPLAARHGSAVAPVRISPWSLLVFALAVFGRPFLAVVTIIGTGLALRPKIRPMPDLTVEALSLTARGHWYAGLSVLTAVVRAWAPFLAVVALVLPSQRRRLATIAAAGFARRLLDGPRSPEAAAVDVAMGVVDDLAYCGGLWLGALRQRSLKALAPAFTAWPKPARSQPVRARNGQPDATRR